MSFEKVADTPATVDAEYHNTIANNGKIWLFSKKFVNQPSFNYGHHVSLAGGYSTFFDTTTNEWDAEGKKDFPAISDREDAEELLFTFRAQIYMLLYSHFGGLQLISLYKFDEKKRAWEKFADLEADAESQPKAADEKSRGSLILADGEAPDGRYLVSFVGHQISVHLLRLSGSTPKVEFVGHIPGELNIRNLTPTSAAFSNGQVDITGGMTGCGFRWDPKHVLRLDVESKHAKLIEIDGDKATFGFSGARTHLVRPEMMSWLHVTGLTHTGMTGSAFNGDIWALTGLITDKPTWEKSGLTVPDVGRDGVVAVDPVSETVYAISKTDGVQKAIIDI
ncbi:Protein F52E4.5 [Aphelenchoides avenae]|nr:Protein F52E4.5 [Aphelenchus avenae]